MLWIDYDDDDAIIPCLETPIRGMIGSRFLMLGLSLLGGYRALALPAPDGSGQAPFDVDIIKPDVKSPRPLVIWYVTPPPPPPEHSSMGECMERG